MKIGFGFYVGMLTEENLRFARQCGATHAVVHLVDYSYGGPERRENDQPVGSDEGWGIAGHTRHLWTRERLAALAEQFADHGLTLEAIENFDPAFWYDILLDGPERASQIEQIKEIIRSVGAAGIPIIGYNFSLAGVAGRVTGPFARGEARSVGMDGPVDTPLPPGMVWNMRYDEELFRAAQSGAAAGTEASAGGAGSRRAEISQEELWERLKRFLAEVVPVAEESGVRLAAHPDDPPLSSVRGTPRLVYEPHMYQRLIDACRSRANSLELCIGTMAEMRGGDIYEALERYLQQERVAYIHFRNVRGKAPHYVETFIDEGDVDMRRVVGILKRNRFDGVLIPDHTPQMSCDAPWHAGMAYALGYINALVRAPHARRV